MHNQHSQHESVPSTHFELKKPIIARAEAANFSRQKVRDVVEESTTNNRQEHTTHDTAHPIATAAFPSCVISRDKAMKQRIYASLVARYPTLKPYQAEKAAANYVDVMLEEIAESIRRFGYKDDQISLALDKVSDRIGRVKVNRKNVQICRAVNADRDSALIRVDFVGQVGKNSRVSINPMYYEEIDLAIAASKSHATCSGDADKSPNIYTLVDPGMLESFIENTRQNHEKASQHTSLDNEEYRKTLLRNLLHARHIRASLIEENGQCLFAEYWEQSDSGRCYGHGTSLQRVSKEVRHGALGRCHMYDVKAASYALLTGLAIDIDPTLDIDLLVDYVNRRSQIRKDIATDVGVKEDKIKEIFTSLGFGAKVANNPYASIRRTLSEAAYNRLMMNDQFVRIGDAMKMVRDVIAGHYSDSFEIYGQHYDSVCPRTGKKRKKDQKLAWIYQAMEAYAITSFGACAVEAGYQPLLFVHDCVYFKHKLPEAVLAKITNDLQQTFPLLETDHEMIHPIHTADFVDPVYAQEAKRIEEHKALMRQLSVDAIPNVSQQPEVNPWHDEFAGWMSMNDMPDFSNLFAGALQGSRIDLGRSIDLVRS